MTRIALTLAAAVIPAGIAEAQFDPTAGAWGKDDPRDLRVMTWNIHDGIDSEEGKVAGYNNWHAIVLTVASFRPDVLIMQEAGDTGSGGDSVSVLENCLDLFLHGGQDPYTPGTPQVTSYVQLYAPDYDLPYVYVSANTDNYNRNVLLSRFPFMDLNGDTKATYPDIPAIFPDAYAPGGNGGVRGFQMAEIDLPDQHYLGDVVVGNCHLKAYGDPESQEERITASQNIAYVIDYWYNGAGTGSPDPNSRVRDYPAATDILDEYTPVIWGGDWNEDEYTNGRKGPAEWFTRAEFTGGNDGTDRDRTDSVFDLAVNPFSGTRYTYSSSKLDYLAAHDSITVFRNSFVFNSAGVGLELLPEIISDNFPNPLLTSGIASDHRAVVVDFHLPLVPGTGDADGDSDVDLADAAAMQDCLVSLLSYECTFADLTADGTVDLADWGLFVDAMTGPIE